MRPASLVAAAVGGVLLGALPLAWALVRWRGGVDLAAAGSANVGAHNTLRTTGSKGLGALVLGLDALKGVAAVLLGWALAGETGDAARFLSEPPSGRFWHGAAGMIGAVAGHNYNPILSLWRRRLVGGKGLATTAGGLLLLMPVLVPVWAAVFALGLFGWARLRGVRDAIAGNVPATVVTPFAAGALYGARGALVAGLLALLILPKHVRQVRALWRGEPTEIADSRRNTVPG